MPGLCSGGEGEGVLFVGFSEHGVDPAHDEEIHDMFALHPLLPVMRRLCVFECADEMK